MVSVTLEGQIAMQRHRVGRVGLAALGSVLLSIVFATNAVALSWGADIAVSKSAADWAYPGSLAVSSSTTAHVVYEQSVFGYFGVYYRRTTNSGATWSPPILLSRPDVADAGVPVIEASGSSLVAAWLESDDVLNGVDTIAVARRSSDGGATWGAPVQLTPSHESAGYPRLGASGKSLTIAWTNGYNGAIYIRRSADFGVTWSNRQQLATTTNKPFGGSVYEGFPVPAIGTGVQYVVYVSAAKTVKVRRSTNGGATWAGATTLATNASNWQPTVAAAGSKAIVGYSTRSSTDAWTTDRITTDKGASWSSVKALSPSSAYRSFEPVVAYRGGRWMAIFERCLSNSCGQSAVYYRSSTNGTTWSSAIRVSVKKRAYAAPGDVDVATRTLVVYDDYNDSANDPYVRVGS